MVTLSSHAIQVENLRHIYRRGTGTRPALDGMNFSVRRGEIFGLLGPNGAGKTTIVKVLTTILRPSSGGARVNGHDVLREPLSVRRSIAAVLQENAVETLLSTWDNLLLYGYLHGYSRAESRRRAESVIETLELADHLQKRAQSLSGGFKRRLQVAKALMVDTPVLFLDEATTGMDPIIKRRVIDAIRTQARAGRTVLLTTQLLDEAEELCDRMLLMDFGKTLASGTMAELRTLSAKFFHIRLGFASEPDGAVELLRALTPLSLSQAGREYDIVVSGTENEWIRHMANLSERWPLAHLEINAASLEEIFMQLYGVKHEKEEEA